MKAPGMKIKEYMIKLDLKTILKAMLNNIHSKKVIIVKLLICKLIFNRKRELILLIIYDYLLYY